MRFRTTRTVGELTAFAIKRAHFTCRACGSKFEAPLELFDPRLTIAELDSNGAVRCPQCGSREFGVDPFYLDVR